jgi:hypothetical protein
MSSGFKDAMSSIIGTTADSNNLTIVVNNKKGMTKQDYFKFHQDCLDKMAKITAAKNADYTGVGDDPFANFTRVEAVGICSTEQGFLTRMMDKVSRINSFVQKGTLQVKDESVEDTLLDLANYCLLMAGYIKSKNGKL